MFRLTTPPEIHLPGLDHASWVTTTGSLIVFVGAMTAILMVLLMFDAWTGDTSKRSWHVPVLIAGVLLAATGLITAMSHHGPFSPTSAERGATVQAWLDDNFDIDISAENANLLVWVTDTKLTVKQDGRDIVIVMKETSPERFVLHSHDDFTPLTPR